ncbi:MAG TPA: hypothetical protein VM571_11480 [Noviherbaspirillum sp.]|nr:hypothetical protein [Noviherbaspirillum sp.]
MRSSITGQSSNAINFQQPSNTVSGSHDNRQNAPAQQETQPVQTPAYAQNQSSKNASSLRKKFMSSEAYKSEQTNKLIREAKNGNIERVQHYIAKGADLTHAVHKAINDVDALAGLLSVGGDPNCMHNGLTPADRAHRARNVPALAVLRSDPRFDPTRIVDLRLRTTQHASVQTDKLIREAKNGNIERAQHYIANGANLTRAVHKAINDVDALAGLLSVGGDPNCMHKGLTPADRADREKNAPALAVLRSDPRFDPQRIVDSHLRTIMQQSVWSHSRANSHPTGHAEWHDPDSVDPLSVPGR